MNKKDKKQYFGKIKGAFKKFDINKAALPAIVILSAISILTIYINNLDAKVLVNGNNISDKKLSKVQSCIYLSGEVKKEGLVCVDKDSTISKAIDKAGGINKGANISLINIDRKVVDGEKLLILSEEVNSVDKLETNISNKVNINTAKKEELDKLEGIGPSTAIKIIEYRNVNLFESIEELKEVPGIGDAKYIKIAENICVD